MDDMTAGRAVPGAGQFVCVDGKEVFVAIGVCLLGIGVDEELIVLVSQALRSTKQPLKNKRKR